jgi:hypothetical protein
MDCLQGYFMYDESYNLETNGMTVGGVKRKRKLPSIAVSLSIHLHDNDNPPPTG